jgi:hypothetical protein
LIRKVDSTTNRITNIAGARRKGFCCDGGPATSAYISEVRGLTLDIEQKNLYFSDSYANDRIRKVNLLTNIISTFAGTGNNTYNGENILATNVNMLRPGTLCFDTSGSFLYYSDIKNNRIRKIDMQTNLVTTVAGNGFGYYSTYNVPATSSPIYLVDGLVVDGVGNIYFSPYGKLLKVDHESGF